MAFELRLDIGDLTRQEREVQLGPPIYDLRNALVVNVGVLRLPLGLTEEEHKRRVEEWLRQRHPDDE